MIDSFGKLKAIVLRTIEKEEFDKGPEGKQVLSAEDKLKLRGSFTDIFIEKLAWA